MAILSWKRWKRTTSETIQLLSNSICLLQSFPGQSHYRPRAYPRTHSCYKARGWGHVHPGAESYRAGFSGVCSCPCSHPQGLLGTLLPSTFLDLLTLVVPSNFQAPLSLQVWPGSLVALSSPVPPSFLAPVLHCFCPASWLLLFWLHLAHLLHLELSGSQRSALAEPMTLLTLWTHRLIAPSVVSTVVRHPSGSLVALASAWSIVTLILPDFQTSACSLAFHSLWLH